MGDGSTPAAAGNNLDERAADIRKFLASVRPLSGVCYCNNTAFHSGRATVELIALATEDPGAPMPSAERMLDVLEFVSSIEPIDQEASYTTGGAEHSGFNLVIDRVRDVLSERLGVARAVSHG